MSRLVSGSVLEICHGELDHKSPVHSLSSRMNSLGSKMLNFHFIFMVSGYFYERTKYISVASVYFYERTKYIRDASGYFYCL